MTNDTPTKAGHFHAVRFYTDDLALCQVVADFLRDGLVEMQPAVVIATPEHRREIAAQLQARGLDVSLLESNGDLFLLDADLILNECTTDGMPDPSRFTQAMVPLIEKACRGRKDCRIRLYGEMVDLLWKRGQTVAAVRLEMLWNDLAGAHDFSLLCGYSMGNFYKDAAVEDPARHHRNQECRAGSADQHCHERDTNAPNVVQETKPWRVSVTNIDEISRHHTHVVEDTTEAARIN
jgi:hypothetical protein